MKNQTQYLDNSMRRYRVTSALDVAGKCKFRAERTRAGELRWKHCANLQWRDTQEEAQAELDEYAAFLAMVVFKLTDPKYVLKESIQSALSIYKDHNSEIAEMVVEALREKELLSKYGLPIGKIQELCQQEYLRKKCEGLKLGK